MPIKRRSGSTKNPPILSHEFLIQNHADIVSCFAMIFIIGLLFQVTSPVASMFVVMKHNLTELYYSENHVPMYSYGIADLPLIFFYFLICIVIHAVIQEYLLDKISRKLHLSKTKQSKFNESGQLLIFYLLSVVWGAEIIRREGYLLSISKLWTDYPHIEMSFLFKFYFIVQISYWLHNFPELYFQKVKKEEMSTRITYSLLYFGFFASAYIFNFNRVAVSLSVLHFSIEVLFHASRLFYFADKTEISDKGFKLWNILFVLARLASITLSVLTFWYGLSLNNKVSVPSFKDGNFNTDIIRINSLLAVCLIQAWMMWNYITFHLKRLREKSPQTQAKKKTTIKQVKKPKVKVEDDVNDLPEVDQNTKITQRNKSVKAKH